LNGNKPDVPDGNLLLNQLMNWSRALRNAHSTAPFAACYKAPGGGGPVTGEFLGVFLMTADKLNDVVVILVCRCSSVVSFAPAPAT
jgi:hypothetical protein